MSEDFLPYDENVEPIITEPEAAEYRGQVHGPKMKRKTRFYGVDSLGKKTSNTGF